MTAGSWVLDSLGPDRVHAAEVEAARRRLSAALRIDTEPHVAEDDLRFVAHALELRAYQLLESDDTGSLRDAAAQAFQVARTLPRALAGLEGAADLVRLGCLGVLGDRGADVRRLLATTDLPSASAAPEGWGERVAATVFDVWLRLLRKKGWEDLDGVQAAVARLRKDQREHEAAFLAEAERSKDARPAWELMSQYHLAKAAEILGTYLAQGAVDGHYDVREQLEAHFDRAVATAAKGQLMERETLARLLARTARALVDNSIWTVTRAGRTAGGGDTGDAVPDLRPGRRRRGGCVIRPGPLDRPRYGRTADPGRGVDALLGPKPKRLMRRPEQELQRAVVQTLAARYPRGGPVVWFAVPNGGGRSKVEGAILKGQGVQAGMPDLVVMWNPRLEAALFKTVACLGIELKAGKGKQSAAQEGAQAWWERAGGDYVVCRSVDEVVEALTVRGLWQR